MTQMFTDIMIDKRQVEPFVIKQFPRFNLYNKIAEALGEGELRRSGQRIFDIYRTGNDFPAAMIGARAATPNGKTLTLTWEDINFKSLIPGNAIESADTGTWGLVRSTQPGSAIVDFLYSPASNTGFVSTDFAVGTMASDRGDVSDVQNSGSKERLVFKPNRSQNVIGLYRHTADLNYDELHTLTFIENEKGQPYYASVGVMDNLEYVAKMQMVRTIDSPRIIDDFRPVGGGFKWQIQNQGGTYFPISSAIDEATFQTFIDQMIANGGSLSAELLMIAGSSFIGYFQRFMKEYIVTAGVNNTVGGVKVKGIDVTEYIYNGRHIKLICDPMMDNNQIWNNAYSTVVPGALMRSHSAFVFDTAPVQTKQGTVPFMYKYYFGNTHMFMSKVNGLITIEGGIAQIATNSTLNGKLEIVYNCTTQLMNPAACGYIFLVA